MKNFILAAIILLFSFPTYAQFWKRNEKIKLYNVEFKAKEVNGQKTFTGPADKYYSLLLDPLVQKPEYNFWNDVGTFRKNVATAETRNLFDYSAQDANYEHLNSIDFEFYKNKGFDKLLFTRPELSNDSLFLALKEEINREPDPFKKKKILFQDKYRDLRLGLISTRFDVFPKPFTLSKTKVSKFTAELKAKVDSVLVANNIQGNGNVKAYLERLADESTNISGIYYSVSLDNDYEGIIKSYIENNISSIRESSKNTDLKSRFAQQLMKVINQPNAVINSSLVAISLDGNIDNSRVNATEISTKLESEFQIPAKKAIEVSAGITTTFEKHENIRFQTDFNSVYVIRYFSSDEFEELKEL